MRPDGEFRMKFASESRCVMGRLQQLSNGRRQDSQTQPQGKSFQFERSHQSTQQARAEPPARRNANEIRQHVDLSTRLTMATERKRDGRPNEKKLVDVALKQRQNENLIAKRSECELWKFLASFSLLAWLTLAANVSAHDTLNKRGQTPTIYSYSASELADDLTPGPLQSHRLQRPYSWANQRLARLMSNDVGDTDDERPLEATSGGHFMGDLSLLYGQQITGLATKSSPTVKRPGNRRQNRPRRPQTSGTKTKGVKTRDWSQPAAQPTNWMASDVAAPTNSTSGVARQAPKRKNLVCYYGTWAVYRPDGGKFAVEDIDPFLCTHVIYGFTGLSYDNLIKPLDPWNDLEDNYGKGAMKRFTNLKRINPDLKTLVAIGGWNEGSIKYSKMASDPEARTRFVQSVVQFLDKFNFDGLDLDWEYPGSRGGASYDKQNFVKLLRELHEAFQPRGYLLTAAVSAGKWFIDPAYDIPQVSKYLDLINLMAYDYHGGWETKTGMNAPLFSSLQHDSTREEQQLNVNWSVNYWLQMGAPREKLMLGVGSYGRSFTLDRQQANSINAPASQKGRAGPYTREPGSLGYNELCEAFKRQPQSWTIVRDPEYLSPYAYDQERQWVGYDDAESLALKAQFAKSMGLGGMMMWSIETDDFRGSCHNEKFPLLNTIRRVIDGTAGDVVRPTGRPKPPSSSTTRRPTSSSSKRPGGHEIEDEQQGPSSSTKRPRPPPTAGGSTGRPATARPSTQKPPTARPTTSTPTITTVTSTQIPITQPSGFACREAGMFADPKNCRKFIRCVQMGARLQEYSFDCPPGTGFNEQQQYCDHLYNVPQCNAKSRWSSQENLLMKGVQPISDQLLVPQYNFYLASRHQQLPLAFHWR